MKQLIVLIIACLMLGTSYAQTKGSKTKSKATKKVKKQLTEEEMNKNWATYATPGSIHEIMKTWEGDWVCNISSWNNATAPEFKFTTEAKLSMILDGHYLQETHSGKVMEMPFTGISVMSYNNGTGKVESTWIDNMSTGMMICEGSWDAATNTITQTGYTTDPMTLKKIKIRQQTVINADGSHTNTMWMEHDGVEFKSMVINMARKS
jgi:hypothetical protein